MHELVKAYEDRRRTAKVPSSHVLERSGVAPGTVWAWVKKDVAPNLDTLRRVNEALDALIAEKETRPLAPQSPAGETTHGE